MRVATINPGGQDGSFDTACIGTAESSWRSLLADAPLIDAVLSPVLVVAPHPDDETLAAGGLLAQHPSARVLVVTDGEQAIANDPDLGSRRRRELAAALSHLSARDRECGFLGLPDGKVAAYEDRLEHEMTAHLSGVITLIAPAEFDGHTDHDAVGRVCLRLATRHHIRLLRYLVWTWHQRAADEFRADQFVRLPLTAASRVAKLRAIHCFQSQLQGGRYAVVPRHVLPYFTRPYEAFLE